MRSCDHLSVTHLVERRADESRVRALGPISFVAEPLVEATCTVVACHHPQGHCLVLPGGGFASSVLAEKLARALAPEFGAHVDRVDLGDIAGCFIARRTEEAEAGEPV